MSTALITKESASVAVPALIAAAGQDAARLSLEFFTVNIRNRNSRAAYARAAGAFLRWCETRGGRYDQRNDDISVGEVERIGI